MRSNCTIVASLALALLLGACAAPTAAPTDVPPTMTATSLPTATTVPPTASPLPSATDTATEPPTATTAATNTATSEPSPTPSPEPSATATNTRVPVTAAPTLPPTAAATVPPTPVPAGGPIAPGLYPQALPCPVYEFAEDDTSIQVSFCVVSVVVKPDTGNLEFNVSWGLTFLAGRFASKGSDANNPNMYIVDNLVRPYAHIATNGAAKLGAFTSSDKGPGPYVFDGVFVFDPAQSGATTFDFHDDDQGVVIRNISLAGPPN